MLASRCPAWFRASNAMPAVMAPSPMMAMLLRPVPCMREAMAIPKAALMEVLE